MKKWSKYNLTPQPPIENGNEQRKFSVTGNPGFLSKIQNSSQKLESLVNGNLGFQGWSKERTKSNHEC